MYTMEFDELNIELFHGAFGGLLDGKFDYDSGMRITRIDLRLSDRANKEFRIVAIHRSVLMDKPNTYEGWLFGLISEALNREYHEEMWETIQADRPPSRSIADENQLRVADVL